MSINWEPEEPVITRGLESYQDVYETVGHNKTGARPASTECESETEMERRTR